MGETVRLMSSSLCSPDVYHLFMIPPTLGLSHFLCYQSVLARVLLVEKVVRNAEQKEAQLSNSKCLGERTHTIKVDVALIVTGRAPFIQGLGLKNSWTVTPSHKATTSIEENIQAPQEVEMVNEPDTSKVEIENNREDGELPSLNPVATIVKDVTITPLKESGIEHLRRLALITKFVASRRSKGKPVKLPSFKKHDEDLDLMLVSDSEVDEPTDDEATGSEEIKVVDNSWITCGIREYSLLLTRKVNSGYGHMKLEAKKTDWGLRTDEWFNELRAKQLRLESLLFLLLIDIGFYFIFKCFLSNDMKQVSEIIQSILQCALDFRFVVPNMSSPGQDGSMMNVAQ
ncbi:hypothetical protein Tco_0987686, partial [Tanacetum coccineum]